MYLSPLYMMLILSIYPRIYFFKVCILESICLIYVFTLYISLSLYISRYIDILVINILTMFMFYYLYIFIIFAQSHLNSTTKKSFMNKVC